MVHTTFPPRHALQHAQRMRVHLTTCQYTDVVVRYSHSQAISKHTVHYNIRWEREYPWLQWVRNIETGLVVRSIRPLCNLNFMGEIQQTLTLIMTHFTVHIHWFSNKFQQYNHLMENMCVDTARVQEGLCMGNTERVLFTWGRNDHLQSTRVAKNTLQCSRHLRDDKSQSHHM